MSRVGASGDPIVAVIVADSFTQAMQPVTQRRPRALLPIANVPLIEYVLESLVVNGVKDVRLLSYYGAQQIEDHLRETVSYTGKTWLASAEVNVKVIRGSSGVGSVAEALKDANEKNQLPAGGQFLLVPLDVLTTPINLQQLWQRHARRVKESNRSIVMTVGVLPSEHVITDVHTASVNKMVADRQAELAGMMPVTPTTTTMFAADSAAFGLANDDDPLPGTL